MPKWIQNILYILIVIAGAIAWRWSIVIESWWPLIYLVIALVCLFVIEQIIKRKNRNISIDGGKCNT